MTTFVNTVTPFLRILLPTGEYAQFQAGRLDVAEDDPAHEAVMAEAIRNPSISIMVNKTTCEYDGVVFEGDRAAAKLAAHKKAIHFDLWAKEEELKAATVIQREIKARAGYACDVCAPIQTFGSEDDLAAHVALLHATAPELDDEGNTVGGGEPDGRRPGEVAPAAPEPARASTRVSRPQSKTAARRAVSAK